MVSGDASKAIDSFNEIIAFLEGIEDSNDLSSIIASIEQSIAKKADASSLSKVAKSGDYNDLNNKPTIPDVSKLVTIEEVETAFTEFSGFVLQTVEVKVDRTPVITLDDISKVTLDWDKEYHFTLTKDTSVVLYDKPNDNYAHSIEIEMTTGEETYSFSTNLGIQWVKDLEIEPNKRYMIIIDDSMTAMWTAVERSEQ